MQRIGVFVCWCGSNIAGTVDVVKVAEALKNFTFPKPLPLGIWKCSMVIL